MLPALVSVDLDPLLCERSAAARSDVTRSQVEQMRGAPMSLEEVGESAGFRREQTDRKIDMAMQNIMTGESGEALVKSLGKLPEIIKKLPPLLDAMAEAAPAVVDALTQVVAVMGKLAQAWNDSKVAQFIVGQLTEGELATPLAGKDYGCLGPAATSAASAPTRASRARPAPGPTCRPGRVRQPTS